MKLFRCTWEDGGISFALAPSKRAAMKIFDELGEAEDDAVEEMEMDEGLLVTLVPIGGDEYELSEIGDEFAEECLDDVAETQEKRAKRSERDAKRGRDED